MRFFHRSPKDWNVWVETPRWAAFKVAVWPFNGGA